MQKLLAKPEQDTMYQMRRYSLEKQRKNATTKQRRCPVSVTEQQHRTCYSNSNHKHYLYTAKQSLDMIWYFWSLRLPVLVSRVFDLHHDYLKTLAYKTIHDADNHARPQKQCIDLVSTGLLKYTSTALSALSTDDDANNQHDNDDWWWCQQSTW